MFAEIEEIYMHFGCRKMWRVFALLIFILAGSHTVVASEITKATLENGLRVVIVRNSLAPVVTTQINYLSSIIAAMGGEFYSDSREVCFFEMDQAHRICSGYKWA